MHIVPNWRSPVDHLRRQQPDRATLYFCPGVLAATARQFLDGFPGVVSYAVKANPGAEVLGNLAAAGIGVFDVASPVEMRAVRAACPGAVLHYNNPVRSTAEVAMAARIGIASASVDCVRELDKLAGLPKGTEIAVRLALPVAGAAYDFGEKFGVGPEAAASLLRAVAVRGYTPAMTFHPGTQCEDPEAWVQYIDACAAVARAAGVRLVRLNVGGGFAANRTGHAPDLEAVFDRIGHATRRAFGADAPTLVCEPGRAMVAEAFSLVTRVKAIRDSGALFVNDGIYGALAEARDMSGPVRVRVIAPDGRARRGPTRPRVVFGPTCDSLDRLPEPLDLPGDLAEGDYVLFDGMGAYAGSLSTGFNGYGPEGPVMVAAPA